MLSAFDAGGKERLAEFRSQTRARISEDGSRVVHEARSKAELAEFREQLKIERREVANNAIATVRPALDELTKEIERTVTAVKRSTSMLSALSISARFDFGSEKMQRLIAQCERLGPQALKNLALSALAGDGDRHLVAAIATVNASRDSKDQAFIAPILSAPARSQRWRTPRINTPSISRSPAVMHSIKGNGSSPAAVTAPLTKSNAVELKPACSVTNRKRPHNRVAMEAQP